MRVAFLLTVAASMFAAGAGRAETLDVSDKSSADAVELSRRDVQVRIVGPCQAGCTHVLGQIPRRRICVTDGATLGFHLAKAEGAGARPLYPHDIRAWIHRSHGKGGAVVWLQPPEIFRFFRKC